MARQVNILAFDTSSSACSVALLYEDTDGAGQCLVSHQIVPMQHARLLLPTIASLLKSASLPLNRLDAVAYGCGPGSYTGIRIASTAAQGIGFAAGLPLIPVSSLAAIAQGVYMHKGNQPLLVAVDARMGKIYWAGYQIGADGIAKAVIPDQLLKPDAIPPLTAGPWHGVGDGWEKYSEIINKQIEFKPISIDRAAKPTAEAIAKLASIKAKQGEWVGAAEALPVYLG